MPSQPLCKICQLRRARRVCPGLSAAGAMEMICSGCCGEQRESTISCPLDCEYLREARIHEVAREIKDADTGAAPHADIDVTEEFLRQHEAMAGFLGMSLAQAGLETAGAVDRDLASALEALIRTYRTLHSGLVYETRAEDRVAAAVQTRFEEAIAEWQRSRAEKQGLAPSRPAEILGILVFLARLAVRFENHRPRGRRYMDYLRVQFGVAIPAAAPSSRLIF